MMTAYNIHAEKRTDKLCEQYMLDESLSIPTSHFQVASEGAPLSRPPSMFEISDLNKARKHKE